MKSAKTGQRSSTAKRSIANSVDEYLARVPEPARGTLNKIRGMLTRFPTSKGTVRFPVDRPLPAALVKKLVRARIAQNQLKEQKKRKK